MNKKTPAGIVARALNGWAIVDEAGKLVIWTTSPTRMDSIKCRLRMQGAIIQSHATDAAIEQVWRENKSQVEEVVEVRVEMLLN
jgi:hypothetical protein